MPATPGGTTTPPVQESWSGNRPCLQPGPPVRQVTISMMGENQTGECWFGDGKIYLTIPGEPEALELDLNDDGSLPAPFGELKKKGR